MANLARITREYLLSARSEGLEKVTAEVRRLGQSHDAVAVSSEKSSRAQLSVERSYERVRRQIDLTYRAQQKFNQQNEILVRAYDQGLIRSTNELALAQSRAHAQFERATRAANDNQRSTRLLAGAMGELNMRAEGFAAQAGIIGGVLRGIGPVGLAFAAGLGAGVVSVTALGQAAVTSGQQLGELRDRAAQFDLSTDILQGLSAAGIEAGITTSQINTGLSKMSVELGKAAVGEGELIEKLGLYAPAAALQIKYATDQEQRLRALIAAFSDIEDPAQRSALAVAAFGRSGADLGRFFAGANGDLDAMIAKAREAGLVLDKDLIDRGDAFSDRLAKASAQITTALTPALVVALEHMADAATEAASLATAISNISFPAAPDWFKALLDGSWDERLARASRQLQERTFGTSIPAMLGLPDGKYQVTPPVEIFARPTPAGRNFDQVFSQFGGVPVLHPQPPRRPGNAGMLSDEAYARQREEAERRVAQAVRDGEKAERERAQSLRQVAQYQMSLGTATEAVRVAQLELQKAQEQGIITEQQYGELVSDTTLRLEQQAAQNRIRREGIEGQLAFEREQIFRSDTEQRIAATLRQNGIEAGSEQGNLIAGQVRLNEVLEDTKKLAKEALTGFATDMMNGVKAADALEASLKRVGQTLQQKGIEKAIVGVLSLDPVSAGVGAATAAVGYGLEHWGEDSPAKERRLQMMQAIIEQEEEERVRLEEERVQIAADLNRQMADNNLRILDAQDRTFRATTDSSTLTGSLAQFERDAQRQREEEAAQGGAALAAIEEALAAERLQVVKDFATRAREAEAAIAARRLGFQDRFFTATNPSTLEGSLAAFDRQAMREREEEIRLGGEAIVELEAAHLAERFSIQREFGERSIAEQRRVAEEYQTFISGFTRRIREYIDGLRAGSTSPLSPADRLAAAQSQYDAQRLLAQGGNRDALGGITSYASDLLDASKAFHGSAAAFQNTFNTVTAQLTALPSQVSAEQFIVNAIDASKTAVVNATDAMKTAMQSALASNSPSNIASALSNYFNQLDANTDELLTLAELKTGLQQVGVAVESGRLQQIFNTLDADGDGQISRLEAIRGATQGAESRLGTTNSTLDSVKNVETDSRSHLDSIRGIENSSNNLLSDSRAHLDAIRSIQNSSRDLLELMKNQLTGSVRVSEAGLTVENTLLQGINKIVLNTAFNNAKIGAARVVATGGWIDGIGTSTSDSNMAFLSRGEYVVRASEAAKWGGMLEGINAGRGLSLPAMQVPFAANSNGDIVAELRALRQDNQALRAELAAFRRDNNTVTRGAAEEIIAGNEKTMAPMTKHARLQASRAA